MEIPSFYTIFIIFAIGLFLQFWLHEISHIIFGHIFEGRNPVKIWPYPHVYEDRFYFARYEMAEQTRGGMEYMTCIAPLVSGLFYYTLSFLVLWLIKEKNFYLFSFVFFNACDCLFFWYTVFFGSQQSDGKKFLYFWNRRKKCLK
jgi:hypothetical protein